MTGWTELAHAQTLEMPSLAEYADASILSALIVRNWLTGMGISADRDALDQRRPYSRVVESWSLAVMDRPHAAFPWYPDRERRTRKSVGERAG
jgi:hypothetical protein